MQITLDTKVKTTLTYESKCYDQRGHHSLKGKFISNEVKLIIVTAIIKYNARQGIYRV